MGNVMKEHRGVLSFIAFSLCHALINYADQLFYPCSLVSLKVLVNFGELMESFQTWARISPNKL
jgi:hypothetical protein